MKLRSDTPNPLFPTRMFSLGASICVGVLALVASAVAGVKVSVDTFENFPNVSPFQTFNPSPVPEPTSLALLGLGGLALAGRRFHRL